MAEGVLIGEFLQKELRLSLHPQKVSIRTWSSGVDFLGWVCFPDHRVLRTTTKRRMLKRLAGHPAESVFNSYLGLLVHGNAAKVRREAERVYLLATDAGPSIL